MKFHNCVPAAAIATFLCLFNGLSFAGCADYVGTYHAREADSMSGERYYAIFTITDEGNFYRVLKSRDSKVKEKWVAECENNKLVLQAGLGKINMYLNRARDLELVGETWKRGSPPVVGNASAETQTSRQQPKHDDGVIKAIVGLGLARPTRALPSQFHVRNTISGKTHTFQFDGVLDNSVPWIVKTRLVGQNYPGDVYALFGMLTTLAPRRGTDGEWADHFMKNLSFSGDWKNKKVGSKIEASYQMANANGITSPGSVKCQVRSEVPASAISNKFSGGARHLDCIYYLSSGQSSQQSFVFFDDYQYAFAMERPSFLGAKASFVFVDAP